jgi:hypothetical protein
MYGVATEPTRQSNFAALVQALRQLGWTERQNVQIEVRWSAGDAKLARIYAAQLTQLSQLGKKTKRYQ